MSRWSEKMEFDPILRKNEITMLVASPETLDLQNEVFSAEVIQEMQRNYELFKHFGVQHRSKVGKLYDLENMDLDKTWQDSWDKDISLLSSFIVPNDTVIENNRIKKGSWIATAKVHNKEIWQKIKDKELNGCSVGGLKLRQAENSHFRNISAVVAELSLCRGPANRKPFLLVKNLENILRSPYPNFHSCSIEPKEKFQQDSFRTIESKKSKVNLILARPLDSNKMQLQSIRYPVSSYDEDEAREHCAKYENSKFEKAKEK